MNKEVIKRYRPEFDHWLDGGELLDYFTEDNEPEWVMADDKLNDFFDSEKYMYVINDKYVEFRKALAEGKTIQVANMNPVAHPNIHKWSDLDNISFPLTFSLENYRIKPDEPEFKDVLGWEEYYKADRKGNITSKRRDKPLKPYLEKNGYMTVTLFTVGKKQTKTIHRLVLEAFTGEHKDLEVNHIDEDKTNNSLDNLEWMTRKENINHGTGRKRQAEANSTPVKATCLKTEEEFYFDSCAEAIRQGYATLDVYDYLKSETRLSHKGMKWELQDGK